MKTRAWLLTLVIAIMGSGILVFASAPANAQANAGKEALKFLDATAQKAGLTDDKPSGDLKRDEQVLNIIGNIINIVLGFVGIIFFVQMLIAGVKWIMAGGNDEVIQESKKTIKSAVIGVVVVFTAFVLSNFVLNQIGKISQTSSPAPTTTTIGTCKYPNNDTSSEGFICENWRTSGAGQTQEDITESDCASLAIRAGCTGYFNWSIESQP